MNNDTQGLDVATDLNNPYATPISSIAEPLEQIEGDYKLAGRGVRLKAFVIDSLIYMCGFIMLMVIIAMQYTEIIGPFSLLFLLFVFVVFVINVVLLYKDAQTIGKKMVKIKIAENTSGRQAPLRRAFFGRSGIPLALFIFMSVLPLPGKETYFWIIWILFWSINSLTMLGVNRRSLRDYMAGTIVIKA